MRFLILSQYFSPEIGAAQARLLAVARCLRADGHDVHVVTALPNHPTGRLLPGYRMRPRVRETIEGVTVDRTWVYPALGSALPRLVNYLSFAVACVPALLRAPRADYLFVESPPLLLAVPARLVSLIRRMPIVLNVADLWPDSVEQLGIALPPPLRWALGRLEAWAYRNAAYVTAVTEGIRHTLVTDKGVPPEKVLFLPNGVDLETYAPAPAFVPPVPATFVYAGTHGVAHGLETVLRAAALLADEPVRFVFVGDGSEKAALVAEATRLGLTNVEFRDALPPPEVAEVLRRATAGVACLRDAPVLRGARSVKVFSIMATGRPVLYSGAGEDRRILEAADGGVVVDAGDAAALAEGARRLANDADEAARLGANGRRYVEEHLGWPALVRAWVSQFAMPSREGERLRAVYRSYAAGTARARWDATNPGNRAIELERDEVFSRLLGAEEVPVAGADVLEVGCGSGGVLLRLAQQGASPERLVGCDLRLDRLAEAAERHSAFAFVGADGQALPLRPGSFDMVLLFTVVSSILDAAVRRRLAAEVDRVLRPGGVVGWYDIRVRNPRNRNTRPVSRSELGRLFAGYDVRSATATVLPPLARRLPSTLYAPAARLPLVRTHVVAVLRKPQSEAATCPAT